VHIGHGSVIASHCLVNKDIPPYSVAVGVPARVVRNRLDDYHAAEELRLAHEDMARKAAEAAAAKPRTNGTPRARARR
jgi:serine acetyltransferase